MSKEYNVDELVILDLLIEVILVQFYHLINEEGMDLGTCLLVSVVESVKLSLPSRIFSGLDCGEARKN